MPCHATSPKAALALATANHQTLFSLPTNQPIKRKVEMKAERNQAGTEPSRIETAKEENDKKTKLIYSYSYTPFFSPPLPCLPPTIHHHASNRHAPTILLNHNASNHPTQAPTILLNHNASNHPNSCFQPTNPPNNHPNPPNKPTPNKKQRPTKKANSSTTGSRSPRSQASNPSPSPSAAAPAHAAGAAGPSHCPSSPHPSSHPSSHHDAVVADSHDASPPAAAAHNDAQQHRGDGPTASDNSAEAEAAGPAPARGGS